MSLNRACLHTPLVYSYKCQTPKPVVIYPPQHGLLKYTLPTDFIIKTWKLLATISGYIITHFLVEPLGGLDLWPLAGGGQSGTVQCSPVQVAWVFQGEFPSQHSQHQMAINGEDGKPLGWRTSVSCTYIYMYVPSCGYYYVIWVY